MKCKDCKYAPKNYADYCKAKRYGDTENLCPDAFEERAEYCKGEVMDFPNTFEEFTKQYGFKDSDEVYTNGSDLIQVFRVNQWREHRTCKNCGYNYGLANNTDFNPCDIVCDYWDSDGLDENDFCSYWKECKNGK